MKEGTENIIKRFAEAIKLSGYSYAILEKKTGFKRSTLQRYATGQTEKIPMSCIEAIAKATAVSAAWIMGWEVSDSDAPIPYGLKAAHKTETVPRLGRIHCGEPVICEENIEGYDEKPEGMKCDFTLLCEGDSMIEAGINDGDLVYIRQQPEVENGQIAAVWIDGETTLKRFTRDGDIVSLAPANAKYKTILLTGAQLKNLRILGRAVGFTRWI